MSIRMNKSPVWAFFDILETDKKFVICRLCDGKISRGGIGKTASTTPMINHMKNVHKYEYSTLESKNSAKTVEGSITTGQGSPIVNLPHNHVPDMHALARARCRSVLLDTESSFDSTTSSLALGPADVIPILQEPQSMLQVEHSDTENELDGSITESKSLLKPAGIKRTPSKSSTSSATMLKPPPSPESEMCLRWNSHHSNMSSVIPALMDDERYVDVTLMTEGKLIKCHKLILSSCSNYFDEMLKNTNSAQQTIIFLRDIKFWQMKALVDFMYKGEVNVDQSKLESLLKAAEDLQIKGLAGKTPKTEQEAIETPKRNPPPPPPEDLEPDVKEEKDHFFLDNMVLEDDDEEYLPHSEYKKSKLKKNRKRKICAPPDPSSLKHVKINLKGTKSRPNIKQPKFYSPDYPEYDPDRSVSPPKLETDPVFHIDNIKLEPIDIEVPQSPTFFEMNTMMDKSISEKNKDESSDKKIFCREKKVAKEIRVYGKAKERQSEEKEKPSTSKEIILETPSSDPNEPAKIEKITLTGPGSSKEVLNLNKKAIIVKCQNVKKLIDENSSIQKILDAATVKQTLSETDKSKLPQIRVRNLPTTDTVLKKFATTQLTSILKKGESQIPSPSKHIILTKVGGTKPTILRHSLPAKTKEFTTEVKEATDTEIAEKISLLAKTKKELSIENTPEEIKDTSDDMGEESDEKDGDTS